MRYLNILPALLLSVAAFPALAERVKISGQVEIEHSGFTSTALQVGDLMVFEFVYDASDPGTFSEAHERIYFDLFEYFSLSAGEYAWNQRAELSHDFIVRDNEPWDGGGYSDSISVGNIPLEGTPIEGVATGNFWFYLRDENPTGPASAVTGLQLPTMLSLADFDAFNNFWFDLGKGSTGWSSATGKVISLNAEVLPVPEPAEWLFMALGLGVTATWLRTRRNWPRETR